MLRLSVTTTLLTLFPWTAWVFWFVDLSALELDITVVHEVFRYLHMRG